MSSGEPCVSNNSEPPQPTAKRRFKPRSLLRAVAVVLLISIAIYLAAPVLKPLLSPPSNQDLYRQGLTALERKNYPEVRRIISRLETTQAASGFADLLQAAFQLRGNSPQNALRILLALNLDGPLRQEILLLSGEAFYRVGQLADARQALSAGQRSSGFRRCPPLARQHLV
ncbi:MAG UNVERIFIED_CONTAM: hypothetical protein LVR18_50625 [Planctomycetaceae bacterium]|jgi:hypothetical protein